MVKVAVVSYEDQDFIRSVSQFLKDQFELEPFLVDYPSSTMLANRKLDIFLVNSDALNGKDTLIQSFRALTRKKKLGEGKAILMLTKHFNTSDFIRNQESHAMDTIDISSGMEALKVALTSRILGKQLDLFSPKGQKAAEA